MAQSRLKCPDANEKPDNGRSLQVRDKRENFDWKEVRKNIYDHSTMNIGAGKECIKTGYCEYRRKRYSNIEEHVNGEQHKSYVQGTNFEPLDKVINCFPLDRCCPLPEYC